jgi:hypothetical protein
MAREPRPKPGLVTSTCVECDADFKYRRRGRDQLTCGQECRLTRRRRQGSERVVRWALRRAGAAGPRLMPRSAAIAASTMR